MPKRRGLGRDVNKSIEIMDSLVGCLRDFAHMPLKKGLHSNNISDEKLGKIINDTSEKAYVLLNAVEDLKGQIKGVKTDANSRFASRVVARYIEHMAL